MRRTDLKAKLEDLVNRTGRVEDMLDVLAGIYLERARYPEYAELRGQMHATAHVLHEASEAVYGIFEGDDARENPEPKEDVVILRGRRVLVEKQASKVHARVAGEWSNTASRYGKRKDFIVVLDDSEDAGTLRSRVLTDPHPTRKAALAEAERTLELLDEVDKEKQRENPSPSLRRVSPGLYVTQDGMWEIQGEDRARWVWQSSEASDKLVAHLSMGHIGYEDIFPTKAVAVEALFDCLAHAEEYPRIARRLAALAKVRPQRS